MLYDFGFAAIYRHTKRTEEEDKLQSKVDRMIRDSGPMDAAAIPDWLSSHEIKPSPPKPTPET